MEIKNARNVFIIILLNIVLNMKKKFVIINVDLILSRNLNGVISCDDQYYGNPGCIKEKGCSYNNANEQLDCVECKKGYFNMLG